MRNEEPGSRLELIQGTLDMLILRTLVLGPATGMKSRSTSGAPRTRFCKSSRDHSIRRSIASNAKDG